MSDFLNWLGLGERKCCGGSKSSGTSSATKRDAGSSLAVPPLPADQPVQTPVVIFFWSTRCHHCHAMIPALNEAVEALKLKEKQDGHRSILPIYSSESQSTPRSLLDTISGFPTLRFYTTPTSYVEYKGPRDSRSLFIWLLEQLKDTLQRAHGHYEQQAPQIGRGISSRYNPYYYYYHQG